MPRLDRTYSRYVSDFAGDPSLGIGRCGELSVRVPFEADIAYSLKPQHRKILITEIDEPKHHEHYPNIIPTYAYLTNCTCQQSWGLHMPAT